MTEPDAPPRPHQRLRAATQDKHEEVDATFARFDLADPQSYGDLLTAHSRVLPALERALAGHPALPPFPPRGPALADDLARLGRAPPPADPAPVPGSAAAAWGMFYVVEGSRLGGVMIARAVPDTLPKAYLAAGHERGAWRRLLDGFDAAAAGDAGWLDEATTAARAAFDAYRAAVREPSES